MTPEMVSRQAPGHRVDTQPPTLPELSIPGTVLQHWHPALAISNLLLGYVIMKK